MIDPSLHPWHFNGAQERERLSCWKRHHRGKSRNQRDQECTIHVDLRNSPRERAAGIRSAYFSP